ncbi:hypothetical protein MSG28_003349 [Choristoneura fumiferana]|uniref:Uncharacterized protein n=1 Tax=Choristoneura fumiferana TaxID=7141 RepID=A0ACC0KEW4_CHOFU|nr:hypothetical protein MSG28_003349 [Choristoneura fumiferana]
MIDTSLVAAEGPNLRMIDTSLVAAEGPADIDHSVTASSELDMNQLNVSASSDTGLETSQEHELVQDCALSNDLDMSDGEQSTEVEQDKKRRAAVRALEKIREWTRDLMTSADITGQLKFDDCLIYVNPEVNNDTEYCNDYDYDSTWYESSIPSDNDWVCNDELYVANVFAYSRVGEIAGSLFFGWFGDVHVSIIMVCGAKCIGNINGSIIRWSTGRCCDSAERVVELWYVHHAVIILVATRLETIYDCYHCFTNIVSHIFLAYFGISTMALDCGQTRRVY